MPWKTSSQLRTTASGARKLKIGLLPDDGVVTPHPPIARAFKALVSCLSKHPSITLVEFPPLDHAAAWTIISTLYFPDRGKDTADAIDASGEPWRPLTRFIITDNPHCKELTVAETWQWQTRRDEYRKQYNQHWNGLDGIKPPGNVTNNHNGIDGNGFVDGGADDDDQDTAPPDVILCPVGPGCAPPLNCARYWSYTSQWNLLDYPALVFPTGLSADPAIDTVETVYGPDWTPRNADDEYNHRLYVDGEGAEKYRDAPICLQLVGRRYEDEKVLQACDFISQLVGLPFKNP